MDNAARHAYSYRLYPCGLWTMPFRDILLALTTILLWSGNFVAIKIGVGELPPMILLTLRFSLTALVFLPFIKWPDRKKIVLLAEISLYLRVI